MDNFRILPHNELGVQKVLSLINQLIDKNESFYERTLNYMSKEHLPFNNSVIVYQPVQNRFNFLSVSELTGKTFSKWNIYTPGVNEYIREREKGFIYETTYPFQVIVADANWIFNEYLTEKVDFLYNYMVTNTKIERELWKSKLSINRQIENKPLF